MTAAIEFVSSYTAAACEQINFAWNGKHAAEFQDANQDFRWQVVERCIAQPEDASVLLLEHLFLADAAWAAEAWGSPRHFAQLGRVLLERGQEAALESFSKGFIRSFDTFGACYAIQLSKPLLERLIVGTKVLLSQATEENDRKRLEAVQELFAKWTARLLGRAGPRLLLALQCQKCVLFGLAGITNCGPSSLVFGGAVQPNHPVNRTAEHPLFGFHYRPRAASGYFHR